MAVFDLSTNDFLPKIMSLKETDTGKETEYWLLYIKTFKDKRETKLGE